MINTKKVYTIFLLFLISSALFAKEQPLPHHIQQKISSFTASKSSWYIRKASGSKAGKVIYGPFENKEQALCVWYFYNLEENKKQCIAKHTSFITRNPSVFYKKEAQYIKTQIEEVGINEVLDKYFLGVQTEISETPATTEAFVLDNKEDEIAKPTENNNVEQKESVEDLSEKIDDSIVVENISEKRDENNIDEHETVVQVDENIVENVEKIDENIIKENISLAQVEENTVIEQESVVEVEDNTIIENDEEKSDENIVIENLPIIPSSITRYKKEYLPDFAPTKTIPLPSQNTEQQITLIENPDECDEHGTTLLMDACEKSDIEQIKLLIKSGADVNKKDNDGYNALMYAVRYQNNKEVVELLINQNINVKEKNNFGLTPLLLAASFCENADIFTLLLKFYEPLEKEVLQSLTMVLSNSLKNEQALLNKVQTYILFGVPLNVFYDGKTPLMYAAQNTYSSKVLKLLVQNGAKTSIRSVEGKTAFDYAKQNKNLSQEQYYSSLNQ